MMRTVQMLHMIEVAREGLVSGIPRQVLQLPANRPVFHGLLRLNGSHEAVCDTCCWMPEMVRCTVRVREVFSSILLDRTACRVALARTTDESFGFFLRMRLADRQGGSEADRISKHAAARGPCLSRGCRACESGIRSNHCRLGRAVVAVAAISPTPYPHVILGEAHRVRERCKKVTSGRKSPGSGLQICSDSRKLRSRCAALTNLQVNNVN